jgi:hypothetical protein
MSRGGRPPPTHTPPWGRVCCCCLLGAPTLVSWPRRASCSTQPAPVSEPPLCTMTPCGVLPLPPYLCTITPCSALPLPPYLCTMTPCSALPLPPYLCTMFPCGVLPLPPYLPIGRRRRCVLLLGPAELSEACRFPVCVPLHCTICFSTVIPASFHVAAVRYSFGIVRRPPRKVATEEGRQCERAAPRV